MKRCINACILILFCTLNNVSDFFAVVDFVRYRSLVISAQHSPSVLGENGGNGINIIGNSCCPRNYIRERTCITVTDAGHGKNFHDANPKLLH